MVYFVLNATKLLRNFSEKSAAKGRVGKKLKGAGPEIKLRTIH